MKRCIELLCFIYAVLASFGSLCWELCVLRGGGELTGNLFTIEIVFLSFGIVLVMTAYTRASRPLWHPVFPLSPVGARVIRWATIAAIAHFGVWMTLLIVAPSAGGGLQRGKMLSGTCASFALAVTIYMAFHWAFRPEKFLSARVMRIASNPLLYAFSKAYRRRTLRYPIGRS